MNVRSGELCSLLDSLNSKNKKEKNEIDVLRNCVGFHGKRVAAEGRKTFTMTPRERALMITYHTFVSPMDDAKDSVANIGPSRPTDRL